MILSVDQKLLEVDEIIGVSAIFIGTFDRGRKRRRKAACLRHCPESPLRIKMLEIYVQS
ncbi:hypothetical protein NIES25_46810 [Nostoc linckia NIES-25]|nr:hypothetical protein NIES25_46810 [Nostoc linckia NIES-25]